MPAARAVSSVVTELNPRRMYCALAVSSTRRATASCEAAGRPTGRAASTGGVALRFAPEEVRPAIRPVRWGVGLGMGIIRKLFEFLGFPIYEARTASVKRHESSFFVTRRYGINRDATGVSWEGDGLRPGETALRRRRPGLRAGNLRRR